MNGESGCRKQTHFVPGCCKVQHLNMLPYCPFSSPHLEPNTRFLYLCFPCSLHPFFLCGCDRLLNYFKPLWTTKTLHITTNQVDQTWEYRTLESHAGIKMRQGGKCPPVSCGSYVNEFPNILQISVGCPLSVTQRSQISSWHTTYSTCLGSFTPIHTLIPVTGESHMTNMRSLLCSFKVNNFNQFMYSV